MANVRRTDHSAVASQAEPRRTAGQQPIMLARLPRIAASTRTSVEVAPPPSTATDVPTPEELPRLDLRAQIDERVKLDLASEADEQPRYSNVFFADREHTLTHAQQPAVFEPTHTAEVPDPESDLSPSFRRAENASRPVAVSEKLFQLHNQLSPHAGLIVAMALIASAGLLYWMIVGPAQLPTPQFDGVGHELSIEGVGETSHQMPDDYVPKFAVELPKPDASSSMKKPANDDQWNKVTLQTPKELELPTQLPPTNLDESEQDQANLSTQSSYPTSMNPNKLDFEKAMQTPEIARAPSETITR